MPPRPSSDPSRRGGRTSRGGRRGAKGSKASPASRSGRPNRDDRDPNQKGTGRPKGPQPAKRPERPAVAPRKGWGGVARRGAAEVKGTGAGPERSRGPSKPATPARGRLQDRPASGASKAWQQASEPHERHRSRDDDIVIVEEAEQAVKRGTGMAPARTRRDKPVDTSEAVGEFTKAVGPVTAPKLAERLADAGRAFERERYGDARRILQPLATRAPGAAAVRELHGLALYRLGRWRDAVREFEAFRTLTGSVEQHPVLADAYRALGRYDEVDRLWQELRAASPNAALVAEGRMVAAGAIADQGDVVGAIAVLAKGLGSPRKVREHHLRVRYALADLYERAGDVPKARALFDQVAASAPGYADVETRRRALGSR